MERNGMHVKANTTPASAPGGHVWEDENHIVEVPDALGTELLRIAGQFSEVLPTDPEHPAYVEPEPVGDDEDEDDLIGEPEHADGETVMEALNEVLGTGTKKPCAHEGGCGNMAKPGQDFCHWHKPKN